ncbi:MAG: hypothetical protein CVT79_17560 [Alphaproteobacteria bacterium HGW-Alphaproteobacteria-18]|nr:MAG: hypothetical protein CVT79_17560 [Alphaproteobacteria bacterium HGW-Alphaproteobacteria-18]
MTHSLLKPAMAAAALCVTAACASTPSLPPAATLSFASTTGCTETISAGTAELVGIKRRQSSGNVITVLNTESACQIVNGTERPYALYKLPGSVEISTIQAGGVIQVNRLFAAEVMTLDENLAPVRTFGPDAFLHRGGSWSVFFQSRDNERYVAVRANPDLIGDVYHFTAVADEDAGDSLSPQRLRVAYSYEGLAFARVFLTTPAPVGPKEQ